MTDRTEGPYTAGLPASEQVVGLLGELFGQAGYEIEAVIADGATRPPRLRIVVDGDTPLDLETAAELSRSASALLDTLDTAPDSSGGYLLEVSSPGVDRPLTEPKHFRRARGRRAEVSLADGSTLTGRIGALSETGVDLVVRDRKGFAVRPTALADIRRAVVQVEFSPPGARELELAGSGFAGPESSGPESPGLHPTDPPAHAAEPIERSVNHP